MNIIAHIYTDFPEKFGIPRQSGLVPGLTGRIVFEPQYRSPDAVKGIEAFSYLWLLWKFEGTERSNWSATVKPPRLGGNTHVGVFATRSPFRPNPIGLSSVRFERLELTEEGPVITVSGIDMRSGTPIIDIKPYLPYADCHTDATDGFAAAVKDCNLEVDFPEQLLHQLPAEKQEAAVQILSQDPRPHYQEDPERRYGVSFAGFDIRFQVEGNCLHVCEVVHCRE